MQRQEWTCHPIFGDDPAGDDPDRLVFHYTSVERAAAIALQGNLSLGPLERMNDPRERLFKQLTTTSIRVTRGKPPPEITTQQREAVETELWELRRTVRLACFTADCLDGGPGTAMRADHRGFARPRMWAQYGASHQGVVLVFNRSCLEAAARARFADQVRFGTVEYKPGFDEVLMWSQNYDVQDDVGATSVHRRVLDALFIKNVDWGSEREWRVVVDGWRDPACLLDISSSVRGFVLGLDFPPHLLPLARKIADSLDVVANTAQLMSENNVLQPWPMCRHSGDEWSMWTDSELRTRGRIFD